MAKYKETKQRTENAVHTTARVDAVLRKMLQEAAIDNDRTFTAELERRLCQSFEAEGREMKVRKGGR